MVSLGMVPAFQSSRSCESVRHIVTRLSTGNSILYVCHDGIVLGFASNYVCTKISLALRRLKTRSLSYLGIDPTMEVAHIDQGAESPSTFAGLYLFSQAARCVRPLIQCGASPAVELIGPFEQMTLQISCNTQACRVYGSACIESHVEIDPTNMLSLLYLTQGGVEIPYPPFAGWIYLHPSQSPFRCLSVTLGGLPLQVTTNKPNPIMICTRGWERGGPTGRSTNFRHGVIVLKKTTQICHLAQVMIGTGDILRS